MTDFEKTLAAFEDLFPTTFTVTTGDPAKKGAAALVADFLNHQLHTPEGRRLREEAMRKAMEEASYSLTVEGGCRGLEDIALIPPE